MTTPTSPTTPLNLRAERMRRGKSAREIGEEIGVSEDVLLYAERTGKRPALANAVKIADFYGVDVVVQWPLDDDGSSATSVAA